MSPCGFERNYTSSYSRKSLFSPNLQNILLINAVSEFCECTQMTSAMFTYATYPLVLKWQIKTALQYSIAIDTVQKCALPWAFPGGAVVKSPPANAGDTGSSPGLGRSHMPRGTWAREPQLLSLRS